MSSLSLYLESIIEECGGFGRFQFLLYFVTMPGKTGVAWSMLMMSLAGAVPDWWCVHDNSSVPFNTSLSYKNTSLHECNPSKQENISLTCEKYSFDSSLHTIVNEWNLICDRDWISSTITTIQMAGILASGIFAGHLADSTGRKPTYFLSLFILLVGNIGCVFSVSWEMFAAFRFVIGFGLGCYITVFYTFIIEFTPPKYRPVVITIPVWPMGLCVLALVALWLHDWKDLHIANAVVLAPWLLFWWVVPESFRWLVSHSRIREAEQVIAKLARVNGRAMPDISDLSAITRTEVNPKQRRIYSLRDLFSSWNLMKATILLAFCWLSSSYVYYAISFGVQNLSGDIYFNFFLIQVMDIPAMILTYFLANWIGRRATGVFFYGLGGMAGLAVAFIEISDIDNKETIRTVFALVTKVSVGIGWSAVQILTSESYPTVVRNIGYGLQSSIARVGSMVAPQIVYLNNDIPGIMYFLCGGGLLLNAVCCFLLNDTKGKALNDNITEHIKEKDPERERLIPDNNDNVTYTDKLGSMKIGDEGDEEFTPNLIDSSELIKEAENQIEHKL